MNSVEINSKPISPQYNLFTGELEPAQTGELPETGWLFDPDFGVVLPEDVSGREIAVAEGVTLAFPVAAGTQFGQVTIKKGVASVGVVSVGRMASGGRTLYLP